jgi:chromosome segregation ATPase
MLLFISASLIVIFALLAFLNYKKSNQLQLILAEGARKFELQYEELCMAKKRLTSASEATSDLERQIKLLKKNHESEGGKTAKIMGELINTQSLIERKLTNTEAQRDQILAQYETLSRQRETLLAEKADQEQLIKTLEVECDRLKSELSATQRKAHAASQEDLNRLKARINELEEDLKKRSQAVVIDPKELDTLRRRLVHSDQLYHSMKSLRDMADERNQNWEVALRKLSSWILTSSHLAQPEDRHLLQSSIGPIVGEALERIGGRLVDGEDQVDLAVEPKSHELTAES